MKGMTMTRTERDDLSRRIDVIVREHVPADILTDLDVDFDRDHLGEDSIFVVLHMKYGRTTREYVDFMRVLSSKLMDETHTSDGFLFPYVSSRIEEEAA